MVGIIVAGTLMERDVLVGRPVAGPQLVDGLLDSSQLVWGQLAGA